MALLAMHTSPQKVSTCPTNRRNLPVSNPMHRRRRGTSTLRKILLTRRLKEPRMLLRSGIGVQEMRVEPTGIRRTGPLAA
jgi:hypothetical protein